MASKTIIDGIRLALAKSLQEAVDNIQANAEREAAGHLKLQKNDDQVHDPAAVEAAIQRYHSAAKAYQATKPARSAAVNSVKNDGAPIAGFHAAPKRIPSLKKPSLGKEELAASELNKDEKASKARQAGKDPAAVALGRRGGLKGGPARVAHTSHAQREQIAEKGAHARWGGSKDKGPIKDQQFDSNKIKKTEFGDPEPSEKVVDNTGTVIDKPAPGAKLPPKRIPQIPSEGSGGDVTKGKLDKGAIADAVGKAKEKAKAMGTSSERLKDAGFPRDTVDASATNSMKKAGIPAAPTAPKPKMPQTSPASSNPPASSPGKTPQSL